MPEKAWEAFSPQRHRGHRGGRTVEATREAVAAEGDDSLTHRIIGAAIEVHRSIGPGLLESTYEACLCEELRVLGLSFRRQVEVPVVYRGVDVGVGYRLDLVVESRVLLELKAFERLEQIHHAQVLTYMKLSRIRVGLLINFNTAVLKNGIKRFVL
jgi:GxxExxY protein